jgi:peptidyl-prolyl cis-trans isomerase B (cyclophilin B)
LPKFAFFPTPIIILSMAITCSNRNEEVLKTYSEGEKQEVAAYQGQGADRRQVSRTGYYRDGTISFEETYQEGELAAYRAYWNSGQLKARRDYSAGQVALEEYFDSDGVPQLTRQQIKERIAGLADFKSAPATADDIVTMETSAGIIRLKLYTDLTPGHANNFKKLANYGFYDGTTFHRVMPGFVIQGGDINSRDPDRANDGRGDPGYSIDAEFNPRPHVKGTLAMARSPDPNSAGSQFYIALGRLARLDNQYTVFGQVIEGLEVVDSIAAAATDSRDNPIRPQRILKVRVE